MCDVVITAARAFDQVLERQGIMGAAAIAACLRNFTFRQRTHRTAPSLSSILNINEKLGSAEWLQKRRAL